ncbi:MAG: Manganese transport protein MntH [Candidatus Carbobacillus altaicus]|uniref:Divalent metal cation transporter MntH n=1 Tax=Candidatus Carbonibacillus altaicus TaxID=2163959 RepID=A0A2R6Y3H3_9BACL|nr:MAG: Manganese transport protein MntH [Candidatus Carbobacillus altaicus]
MYDDKRRHVEAERALYEGRRGFRGLIPFLGPAFIASVAYIDPGNFATNIAAGSTYGYMLLWVVLGSNLMAILVQSLSAKLGIATGMNLPEVFRAQYGPVASFLMWIQGELIVIATDLAEFLGGALGLSLLFNLSLFDAALIVTVLSFLLLELQRRGVRALEAAITALVMVVVFAFVVEMFFSGVHVGPMLKGLFIPRFADGESVLLGAGILGATVMPHAIYLHSALVQKRVRIRHEEDKKKLYRLELIDIWLAMGIAGVINMSMLIVAAALFHQNGLIVTEIDDAARMLGELIGPVATLLFGLGLLAAGLSSSSVGILSGDVIMQGFIRRHIPIYLRRAVSIIPPLAIILSGISPTLALLLSQVFLSFGIAFALVPLIILTSQEKWMGALKNGPWTIGLAVVIAAIVIVLNAYIIYMAAHGVAIG